MHVGRKLKVSSTAAEDATVDDPKNVVGSFHALCGAYLVKPIKKASLVEELRKMRLTV